MCACREGVGGLKGKKQRKTQKEMAVLDRNQTERNPEIMMKNCSM